MGGPSFIDCVYFGIIALICIYFLALLIYMLVTILLGPKDENTNDSDKD